MGISARDWTLQAGEIGVTIATWLITQWIAVNASRFWSLDFRFWSDAFGQSIGLNLKQSKPEKQDDTKFQNLKSLLSAMITGLGLSLLLRTDNYLSPEGQAEVTNYRTVKIPSDAEVPLFVRDEFSDFYQSMFATTYDREGRNIAFLEYAWDMAGCDPCSADLLTPEELQAAGVFWLPTEPAIDSWNSRPTAFS